MYVSPRQEEENRKMREEDFLLTHRSSTLNFKTWCTFCDMNTPSRSQIFYDIVRWKICYRCNSLKCKEDKEQQDNNVKVIGTIRKGNLDKEEK